MKILRITCLLLPLLFPAAWADSNTVASANILGYTKITIPSNQLVLISTRFINSSNTVNGLFGSLPNGSAVYFWDTASQVYSSAMKTRSGWGAFGTNTIDRGAGVFLALPANTQTNVILSGTVPTDNTAAVYVVNGLALVSYPYPSATAFTNTTLAISAASGDSVSFWNNGWLSYMKTRSGWGAATNKQIGISEAFFFKGSSSATRQELQPYSIQ